MVYTGTRGQQSIPAVPQRGPFGLIAAKDFAGSPARSAQRFRQQAGMTGKESL